MLRQSKFRLIVRYIAVSLLEGVVLGVAIFLLWFRVYTDLTLAALWQVFLICLVVSLAWALAVAVIMGFVALLGKVKPFYLDTVLIPLGIDATYDLCVASLRAISATRILADESNKNHLRARVGFVPPSRFVFELYELAPGKVQVTYSQFGLMGLFIARDDFDRVSSFLVSRYSSFKLIAEKSPTTNATIWEYFGMQFKAFPVGPLVQLLSVPFHIAVIVLLALIPLSIMTLIAMIINLLGLVYALKGILAFASDLVGGKAIVLRYLRQGTLFRILWDVFVLFGQALRPNTEDVREQTRALHQRLLDKVSKRTSPHLYAMICLWIGQFYIQSDIESLDDLRLGIHHLQEALRYAPEQCTYRDSRYTAHALLGQAYLKSSRVLAKDELISKSISHFERARELCGSESSTNGRAIYRMSVNGLGQAYLSLGFMALNKEEYRRRAVEAFEELLRSASDDSERFVSHSNLGKALLYLTPYEPTDYSSLKSWKSRIHRAIYHLESALSYWRPYLGENLGQADYARVHIDLADALFNLRNRAYEPMAKALLTAEIPDATAGGIISHYEEAIRFLDPVDHPYEYANILNKLGAFQESEKKHAEAIASYRRGLASISSNDVPGMALILEANLANAYFFKQDWEEAWRSYQSVVEASKRVYDSSSSILARTYYLSRTASLYQRGAYAACMLGRHREALDYLDRGRTRMLTELVSFETEQPMKGVPENLWARYGEAKANLKSMIYSWPRQDHLLSVSLAKNIQDVHNARASFHETVDAIRSYDPDFLKEDDLALESPDSILTEDSAIVTFCVTELGSVALVVLPDDSVHVVWLVLEKGGLDTLIFRYRRVSRGRMPTVLRDIGKSLIYPLFDSLPSCVTKLLLALDGELLLLPLHAVPLRAQSDHCLSDRYTIGYTPSLNLSCTLHRNQLDLLQRRALVVANPTLDLPHTLSEALMVRQQMNDSELLWEQQADKNSVSRTACGASVLHFACHCRYNVRDPSESGLLLCSSGDVWPDSDGPPGEYFTVIEISRSVELPMAELVVLSACESGLAQLEYDLSSEYIGLPGSFLQAGARAVVASLWAVDDLATALLMGQFYRAWDRGAVPVAEALQAAQKWLRTRSREQVEEALDELDALWIPWATQSEDSAMQRRATEQYWEILRARRRLKGMEERPFGHPYWWAGFQAVGDVL